MLWTVSHTAVHNERQKPGRVPIDARSINAIRTPVQRYCKTFSGALDRDVAAASARVNLIRHAQLSPSDRA
jgi:hypothetical protein